MVVLCAGLLDGALLAGIIDRDKGSNVIRIRL
jgi:hypothetical protein